MLDETLRGMCVYFLGFGLLCVRGCKRERAIDIVGRPVA
jgi:hypothetical protein